MNDNELMHYGVLGMRWGHHKSPESYGGSITKTGKYRASNGVVIGRSKNAGAAIGRRLSTTVAGRALSAVGSVRLSSKQKDRMKKEQAALKEYQKAGGDKMFDRQSQISKTVLSNKQKKDDKGNKRDIDKAYNKILSGESIGSKLMYNDGTYRKAAKNMVNKGMDQKTAVSKAKAAAWRNAGLGIAASVVFANSDKLISGVKQYAITKAMQRVNKGLNRIGTMKLVKVAENVYERRMV